MLEFNFAVYTQEDYNKFANNMQEENSKKIFKNH